MPRFDGFVPGRWPLDAIGAGGFRFAEMSHKGSIIATPAGIRIWPVTQFSELTLASLQPVLDEAEAIDFLIIGAAKSATTWLQKSLQADPAVSMPDAGSANPYGAPATPSFGAPPAPSFGAPPAGGNGAGETPPPPSFGAPPAQNNDVGGGLPPPSFGAPAQ